MTELKIIMREKCDPLFPEYIRYAIDINTV